MHVPRHSPRFPALCPALTSDTSPRFGASTQQHANIAIAPRVANAGRVCRPVLGRAGARGTPPTPTPTPAVMRNMAKQGDSAITTTTKIEPGSHALLLQQDTVRAAAAPGRRAAAAAPPSRAQACRPHSQPWDTKQAQQAGGCPHSHSLALALSLSHTRVEAMPGRASWRARRECR
jgi:hypothetical protein